MVAEFETDLHKLAYSIAKSYGFDAVGAKMFVSLYIEPSEISLDELAKKTGYSLSAISTKAAALEALGVVQRIKKPGSRKVYLYMEKNLYTINRNKLKMVINSHIVPVRTKLPQILKKHERKIQAGKDERQKAQLKIMQSYLEQLTVMEKLINDMIKKMDKQK
ncbi:MAG: hypothetical protein V1695_01015 [Candidatus Uhrbacteria bacterium]